jgi:hypothetical protein
MGYLVLRRPILVIICTDLNLRVMPRTPPRCSGCLTPRAFATTRQPASTYVVILLFREHRHTAGSVHLSAQGFGRLKSLNTITVIGMPSKKRA